MEKHNSNFYNYNFTWHVFCFIFAFYINIILSISAGHSAIWGILRRFRYKYSYRKGVRLMKKRNISMAVFGTVVVTMAFTLTMCTGTINIPPFMAVTGITGVPVAATVWDSPTLSGTVPGGRHQQNDCMECKKRRNHRGGNGNRYGNYRQ